MGEHIDDLEKHINGLLEQAGVENATEELTVRILLYKGMLLYLLKRKMTPNEKSPFSKKK